MIFSMLIVDAHVVLCEAAEEEEEVGTKSSEPSDAEWH